VSTIPGNHEVRKLQKTAILGINSSNSIVCILSGQAWSQEYMYGGGGGGGDDDDDDNNNKVQTL
jgi:hypothetical protein